MRIHFLQPFHVNLINSMNWLKALHVLLIYLYSGTLHNDLIHDCGHYENLWFWEQISPIEMN